MREFILSQQSLDLKTSQRFADKTTSFSITVSAARLYSVPRFVLFRPVLSHPIDRLLSLVTFYEKSNIGDSWITGKVVFWFDERLVVISTFSDASNSGWGGVFSNKSGNSVQVRDYWLSVDSSQPILIREALAFKNTLMAGAASSPTNLEIPFKCVATGHLWIVPNR